MTRRRPDTPDLPPGKAGGGIAKRVSSKPTWTFLRRWNSWWGRISKQTSFSRIQPSSSFVVLTRLTRAQGTCRVGRPLESNGFRAPRLTRVADSAHRAARSSPEAKFFRSSGAERPRNPFVQQGSTMAPHLHQKGKWEVSHGTQPD